MTALEDIFQQELGRGIDPGGQQFFQNQLNQGVPLSNIQQSIAQSAEGRAFDQRLAPTAQTGQPLGLSGAEQALQGGLRGGVAALQEGSARSLGATQRGAQAFDPFIQQGQGAGQQQAALSGALGSQAQQQAISAFQASPGQQFLQERGERAVTRNAAATGGLGGGRVLQELQRQGIGLAQQDFGNQFNRLGQVAQQGLQGAGQRAGLFGQQAGIQAGLGGQAGQMAFGTGQQLAAGRTRAAEQIGQQIQGTAQGVAGLQQQQGQGLQQILSQSGGNLANLLSGAGTAQGASNQQLAALLANISSGGVSNLNAVPGITAPSSQSNVQNIGALASGGGALLGALSDRRLKKNIVKIGETKAGLNLYSWDWRINSKQLTMGVMADEAMQMFPDAVMTASDGFMRVDYSRIG